nr:phage holin family protein [uncultured Nocardioides sp.]
MTAQHGAPEGQTQDQTLGALVHQLTQQVPELIRSEMRLAQAEVAQKGKRAGVGIGMFSVAGLLGFFAFGSIVATAILALSLVVDAWLAALIVALVLLVGAAVAGMVGKNKVAEAGPPAPERAIQGLKEDIATVKGDHHE